MSLKDTTNPKAHSEARTLFNSLMSEHEFRSVNRLSIRMIGLYVSEVGTEWSANGKRECKT